MAEKLKRIKPESFGGIEAESKKKYYPNISLSLKDIPEAEDWEVGESYEIELEVKMISLEMRDGEKGRVSFDIVGIMVDDDEDDEEE